MGESDIDLGASDWEVDSGDEQQNKGTNVPIKFIADNNNNDVPLAESVSSPQPPIQNGSAQLYSDSSDDEPLAKLCKTVPNYDDDDDDDDDNNDFVVDHEDNDSDDDDYICLLYTSPSPRDS